MAIIIAIVIFVAGCILAVLQLFAGYMSDAPTGDTPWGGILTFVGCTLLALFIAMTHWHHIPW